ncbi:hypothetical protein ACTM9K_16455, partial [Bariatricus sp. HCP3S3_E12]|uniref:hypothetical protein n=1 Tax=Bariatricus sp. HCP3S3_E12 TaxID=3438906 RepID=UPI003F896623
MIVNRICGMCQGGCQVNVTIEYGKIVRVEPDKASPKGRLCVGQRIEGDANDKLFFRPLKNRPRSLGANGRLTAIIR